MISLILIICVVVFCNGVEVYPKGKYNLIWYQSSNANTYVDFINDIDTAYKRYFLGQYNYTNEWGPCVSSNSYSFSSTYTGPCIFFDFAEKLERTPDFYNVGNLPQDFPDHLRQRLEFLEKQPNQRTNNVAYITCDGESPVDKENIGPLIFWRGYELGILPDSEPTTFNNNLIAVHFEKPMRYIVINVECKIWAIFKTKADLERSTFNFYLLID